MSAWPASRSDGDGGNGGRRPQMTVSAYPATKRRRALTSTSMRESRCRRHVGFPAYSGGCHPRRIPSPGRTRTHPSRCRRHVGFPAYSGGCHPRRNPFARSNSNSSVAVSTIAEADFRGLPGHNCPPRGRGRPVRCRRRQSCPCSEGLPRRHRETRNCFAESASSTTLTFLTTLSARLAGTFAGFRVIDGERPARIRRRTPSR